MEDTDMHDAIDTVQQRVASAVDGFRDRTADVVRADGGSVFRELSRLGHRIDDVERSLDDRIGASEALIEDRIDTLIATDKRTTLPRKLFWLTVGAGVGAAAAYLADPDRGATRRAELAQQASARARDVAEQAQGAVTEAVDRAKGEVIEQARDLLPEDVPLEPQVLEHRIKTEVFGGRDDVEAVVLRIDGPGVVALKGTVPTSDSEADLLTKVAEVEGVLEVTSELQVRVA